MYKTDKQISNKIVDRSGIASVPTKKETLRDRCERLSSEFSPLLAAKIRQTKAAQIMRQRTSFKFRLNQLVSMDARHGQVWPVPCDQLSTSTCATMPFKFLCEVTGPL